MSDDKLGFIGAVATLLGYVALLAGVAAIWWFLAHDMPLWEFCAAQVAGTIGWAVIKNYMAERKREREQLKVALRVLELIRKRQGQA